jgi:chromosome segregation ATPase
MKSHLTIEELDAINSETAKAAKDAKSIARLESEKLQLIDSVNRLAAQLESSTAELTRKNELVSELSMQLDEFRNDYGNALAEIENLKSALQKSLDNNTDCLTKLASVYVELDEARGEQDIATIKTERNEAIAAQRTLAKELQEARAEVERVKQEMNQARKFEVDSYVLLLQEKIKQLKATRPEPSRLEIAAMLKAGWFANPNSFVQQSFCAQRWLDEADELIAAAGEGK